VLFHHRSRCEEERPRRILALQGGARHVGDVEERNGDRRGNLRLDAMHEIGANEKAVGARAFEAAAGPRQHVPRLCPAHRILQRLDLGEIEGMQKDFRRMQPAQTLANALVDQTIVDCRGFTAHSAK
jgi:hypothetical protein